MEVPPSEPQAQLASSGKAFGVQKLRDSLREVIREALFSLKVTAENIIAAGGKEKRDALALIPAPKRKSKDEEQADFMFVCAPFIRFLGVRKPAEASEKVASAIRALNRTDVIDSAIADDKGRIAIHVPAGFLAGAAIEQWLSPLPAVFSEPEKKVVLTGEIPAPTLKDKGQCRGRLVIEYSSPNTNKPQHLGHVRNNVLGHSMSRILKYVGYDVVNVNLINDRGIHICKSMLAYQKWGEGATPESTGIKGDYFVGDYYVKFENAFRDEYKAWLVTEEGEKAFTDWCESKQGKSELSRQKAKNEKMKKQLEELKVDDPVKRKKLAQWVKDEEDLNNQLKAKFEKRSAKLAKSIKTDRQVFEDSYSDNYFNTYSPIGREAKAMLIAWENADPSVIELWERMNSWVFSGFEETYNTLGVSFDRIDKESKTYLLGKEVVEEGLKSNLLERQEDGSVTCDLKKARVPNVTRQYKILLRSDGTSVYMTQDLGTAVDRFNTLQADKMIYVVACEQDNHFQELYTILAYLRPELKNACHHLSYGMVYLPEGRMKSREGKVVEADQLIKNLRALAMEQALRSEKRKALDEAELSARMLPIALAGLKYHILMFHPPTTVTFDPVKSLDFKGNSGPYHLYMYARTRSILRKADLKDGDITLDLEALKKLGTDEERALLNALCDLVGDIESAAETYDPARIADSLFVISKSFSSFFAADNKTKHPIIKCPDPLLRSARLQLTLATGAAIKTALFLLGIDTLEVM